VTGFHQRKEERRRVAQEQIVKKEKERRIQERLEVWFYLIRNHTENHWLYS